MSIQKKSKQPHEVLDYDFDCTRKVGDNDVIEKVTVTITGPDAVLFQPVPSTYSGVVAKVWLAGGLDGSAYKVTVVLLTTGGREVEKEFMLYVKEL